MSNWTACVLSRLILEEKNYTVAYSLNEKNLIWPIIDYCIYLTDWKELNKKTVETVAWNLKRYWEFLLANNVKLDMSSDEVLREFRDRDLVLVQQSKNSRGDVLRAKRTINARLRIVYAFLHWYQSKSASCSNLIGPINCRVTSHLNVRDRRQGGDYMTSPLIFKRVGESSRHRVQYMATDSDVSDLRHFFQNQNTHYVAVRNILIMQIAEATGLRRQSINSLCCEQFTSDILAKARNDYVRVIPKSQKFSYQCSYLIPLKIAHQILSFINGCRRNFLSEMGWSEKQTYDRIFISARDGRPLSDQSLSRIFSSAFKAIGAPPGSALHTFRHKYVNDRIDEETDARIALGLDTSTSSIAGSVSISVGHTNSESLIAYVSNNQSSRVRKKRLER